MENIICLSIYPVKIKIIDFNHVDLLVKYIITQKQEHMVIQHLKLF